MKMSTVGKCDECRNRVLIEETSWQNGKTKKVTGARCVLVVMLKEEYGKIIETYPNIPKWCPLVDYKES